MLCLDGDLMPQQIPWFGTALSVTAMPLPHGPHQPIKCSGADLKKPVPNILGNPTASLFVTRQPLADSCMQPLGTDPSGG